jgi:hypothetical protein
MQATAAPRSENDQRPPSLETAPAVRLSDLGWTACPCLLNCTMLRAATLGGQHRFGHAVLEGIEACRNVQRFCPTAASLEAPDAPGNVRRKAASWAGGLCAASNLPTRNAGPAPASSRRQDRWQGRRLRVWDATVGRGRQHPEGQTQSCHRRCSKRGSQAAGESRREKP